MEGEYDLDWVARYVSGCRQSAAWYAEYMLDPRNKYAEIAISMPVHLVLAHGNFDPLHLGHIRHLQSAAAMRSGSPCSYLAVSLATDEICRIKGTTRPYFPESERVEAVRSLECVTFAFASGSFEAIQALRPDVYVKGPECRTNPTPRHAEEIALVEKLGGRVVYTDDSIYSSTGLMEKLLRDLGI